MTDTIAPSKGRAYLLATQGVAPEELEAPVMGVASSEWMVDAQDLLHTWQAHLLFPEGYTVVGVYFQPFYRHWAIIVESEMIPPPEDGLMIPQMEALYRMVDGKAHLAELRIGDKVITHA